MTVPFPAKLQRYEHLCTPHATIELLPARLLVVIVGGIILAHDVREFDFRGTSAEAAVGACLTPLAPLIIGNSKPHTGSAISGQDITAASRLSNHRASVVEQFSNNDSIVVRGGSELTGKRIVDTAATLVVGSSGQFG